MKELNLILRRLSLIIIGLATFQVAQTAQAYNPERGNVTATLGPYIFRTNYEDSDSSLNSPNLGGLSLTGLGDVSNEGSLEIAVIYMNKIYYRSQDGKSIAEKTQLMHITMGYRQWISNYFSASLGVFTSYPMGGSTIVHSDFPLNQGINTTASEPNETGLDLALQLEVWNKDRFAVVVETRYSYSLTKLANEYADQYGASIGVRYFIQGRTAEALPNATAPVATPLAP